MKFAEIIPALLEGKKVRISWWPEGKGVICPLGQTFPVWHCDSTGDGSTFGITRGLMESTDWEVVGQGMTWAEAQEAMSQGKKVRRTSWVALDSIRLDPQRGPGYFYGLGDPYEPVYSARHATDWEVVE